MKTTAQCVALLACVAICTSTPIMSCRCLKTVMAVNPSLIDDVIHYGPRPYCKKEEVIVTLRNRKSRCLDPNGRFAQELLRLKQMHMEAHAARMKSTRS